MAKLSYKPENINPQGKERVYFACHPDDFKAYFEPVCADIFASQNCVIFYNSEPETPWNEEDMKLELGRMQLIVIPITSRFLYRPNEAREVEFAYAIEKHIPVLPLMQESGLENEFNRICGDLQFLDKNAILKDPTALPYDQKLEKYLKSVLLGDELAAKVRQAFDAYIFLSYRKKDRKYAQELMHLIHKNDFCRDIAIWYDEFLIPGENFNNAIAEAMTKSDLFTFVVTPNLLEPDNYVMKIEYPEARKAGKPILPAEMAETDKDELGKKFEDIPAPTNAHDASALSDALLNNLRAIAIDENNTDPQHNFFIGLAYLGGIDVEVDHEKAVQLITFAAEHNLPEAMEKLADMYKNGEGVERNYETSAQWLDKLVEYWEKRFEESGDEKEGIKLLLALQSSGMARQDMGQLSCARVIYEKMLSIAEKLNVDFGESFHLRSQAVGCSMLGDICQLENDLPGARGWYEKCLKITEQIAEEYPTIESRSDLAISYSNLGDIYRMGGNLSRTKELYESSFKILKQIFEETDTTESRRNLSISYERLGDMCVLEGNFMKAMEFYEMDLDIRERLIKESRTVQSHRDLAVSYEKLADVCKSNGKLSEAREWQEKSLEIFEQLDKELGIFESHRSLAVSYECMAEICKLSGDSSEAREWQEKSLAIFERLDEEIGTSEVHRSLAISYYKMGGIYKNERNIPKAKKMYEQALRINKQLVCENESEKNMRMLSENYERLAEICKFEGDQLEARNLYEKCLEIRKQVVKEVNTVESYDDMAVSYFNLALVSSVSDGIALLKMAKAIWNILMLQCPGVARYADNLQLVRQLITRAESQQQ